MTSLDLKGLENFAIDPILSQFKPAQIFANSFFKNRFSFYSQNPNVFTAYVLYKMCYTCCNRTILRDV
jgi:hypothetical protein